jgi:PPM family protein phosphatase
VNAALQVRAAWLSDVGRTRERNEDACFAGAHTFAVADGLGGHRAGEVASTLALESIVALEETDARRAATKLVDAVRKANRSVAERASADDELRGMGTTLTAVVVSDGSAHLAHVGDSRCYLVRGDSITRLSNDHTLVARMVADGQITQQQAEVHPQRSILTRALGAERDVDVDEARFPLSPGDRLVLCSDGLTAVINDDEIRAYTATGADLQEICRTLIDEANRRGGPDNITVVVVDVEGAPGVVPATQRGLARRATRTPSWQRRRVPVRAMVWVGLVLGVGLAALFTVKSVTNRSYYVGIKDGQVAIFRGVPLEVGSATLSKVEEPTVIPTSSVAPWYLERLEQGIRADSLEDARQIVSEQIPNVQGKTLSELVSPTPTVEES